MAFVLSGLPGRHLALTAVVAAAGVGVARAVDRSRAERRAQARRERAIDFCEALAGELRAGQPTVRALERSAEPWPEARHVVAACRVDASVPEALRQLAELPGAGSVRRLAAAWEISVGTGSGLVVAVEQVLGTARAEDATARLVRAELASARATARLVTALPVVVLLAAQGIGARPWHFLLDTGPGVGCLAAGVALALAGLGWIDRIAARSVDGRG
jgi:tight adherence protein B